MELLDRLKLSIGDYNDTLYDIYQEYIDQAEADYLSEDISETVLASDIGQTAIIAYAICLIREQDIASNSTLIYFRNKMAGMSKGERVEDD